MRKALAALVFQLFQHRVRIRFEYGHYDATKPGNHSAGRLFSIRPSAASGDRKRSNDYSVLTAFLPQRAELCGSRRSHRERDVDAGGARWLQQWADKVRNKLLFFDDWEPPEGGASLYTASNGRTADERNDRRQRDLCFQTHKGLMKR